jgi:hypothetical protein
MRNPGLRGVVHPQSAQQELTHECCEAHAMTLVGAKGQELGHCLARLGFRPVVAADDTGTLGPRADSDLG